MMARPRGEKRADYFIYTWQIRAIRRLAEKRGQTPSQVVRLLLADALAREGVGPEVVEVRESLSV
jgi:hypothetical protein